MLFQKGAGTSYPTKKLFGANYWPNEITTSELGGAISGMIVADNQLIVQDRMLFWNNPASLTSGKAADGAATAYSSTVMAADKNHRLYVGLWQDGGQPARIAVYQLPLTNGATPIQTIYFPIPVLGGGQIVLNDFAIWGIAPTANSEFLWVSQTLQNRVLRIRNPLTNPQVDVILGQTDINGTLPNRSTATDPNIIRSAASANTLYRPGALELDRQGHLWVSDHSLEAEGNYRLLAFNKGLFPTDNTSVIFAPSASKIFPDHPTWKPAFDSLNRMVVGYNAYVSSPSEGSRFPGVYNNPWGSSTTPDSFLKDYYSMAFAAAFDDQDNLYVADLNRAKVMIYKKPLYVPPDLSLTVYGDTRGWYGETRNQRALVVNNGAAPSAATQMKVYLSTDDKWDTSDTLIGTYEVPSLAPSASTRIDYPVALPASWPQRMVYVLAFVDPDNLIAESEETNNTKFRTIGYGKMPYDVDGSGLVTVSDVIATQEAYYTSPGDLKWNSSADVTRDGAIRVDDIIGVNNHYYEVDSHVELHASVSATTITAGGTVTFNYEAHYFYGSVAVLIDPDSNVASGWNFNTGAISNETKGSWTFKYNTKGTYTAKVLGLDSNWYTEMATFTITVQ
jgi:hypothetical protein